MGNLQKNLNIIWQPSIFRPPSQFALPPLISINFENVEPPPPIYLYKANNTTIETFEKGVKYVQS